MTVALIIIDDLRFTLRRSRRRTTVGVTVERDGSLTLAAPEHCSVERIEAIAREKQFWIYTKLAEKHLLFRPPPPKEYVSGEGFHYLGRTYRLKVVDGGVQDVPLRLVHGRFLLRRDSVARAPGYFERWYTDHGRRWLERRIDRLAPRVGAEPTGLEVRDLGYRWGSCSVGGGLNFHWRSLLLPPRIVEYVVAHELVHLLVPNHGAEFWARLERAMPDYVERKQWLAEEGSRFV
jgi:predicted metal-dependent hydrolase